MTVDPFVQWARREIRKEFILAIGVGVLATAVLGLFIAGLVVIAS